MQEDVAHGYGVDAGVGGAGFARGHLPGARFADLVGVFYLLEGDPFGFRRGQVRDAGDDGFLGFGRHREGAAMGARRGGL